MPRLSVNACVANPDGEGNFVALSIFDDGTPTFMQSSQLTRDECTVTQNE